MMYEMRLEGESPSLLFYWLKGLKKIYICMVWEELVFGDAVNYTQWGKWIAAQLNVMAVMGFVPLFPGAPAPP